MAEEKPKPAGKAINVNVAILGHIDSGKTSLCKALSTVTSTASMDKSVASQERGITLDLGFSSFSSAAPEHFVEAGYDTVQFCLVDCPGHASLIRTVLGGAQIVDLCALVIDANKGIQTQTAECLVVAEILANQLVIILNKVDMIPEAKREKTLKSIVKRLGATFAATKFGADLPFACAAASPQDGGPAIGIDSTIELLKRKLAVPRRDPKGPFMFSFDHAFPIKGQGTVLTGTVLSGAVKPGQPIVVPSLGEAGKGKKVRSLQMFKQPVQEAIQGDRVAMCVAALDSKELERGIIIGEKYPVPTLDACIAVVNLLDYFKHDVRTKAKFHVTLGHQTVMATAHFFCPLDARSSASSASAPSEAPAPASSGKAKAGAVAGTTPTLAMGCGALLADKQRHWPTSFDMGANYLHLDTLFSSRGAVEYENTEGDVISLSVGSEPGKIAYAVHGEPRGDITELLYDPNSGRLAREGNVPLGNTLDSRGVIPLKDRDRVLYLTRFLAHSCCVPGLEPVEGEPLAYALLILEKPVIVPLGSLLIGSKFDFDNHSPNCRMAFFGRILCSMDPKNLKALRIVKMKSKVGTLDKFDKQEPTLMICKEMFSAETDMTIFNGLKVVHESSGTEGIIEGSYGQKGLFKVRFKEELRGIKNDGKGQVKGEERISLYFKKYNFEQSKRILQ